MTLRIIIIGLSIGLLSCTSSGPLIGIRSLEPDSVMERVSLRNPEGPGVPLSNPGLFRPAESSGSFIRIQAPKRVPQSLYFIQSGAPNQIITVRRLAESNVTTNRNPPTRLILKAYQALSSNDNKLAREQASRASVLDQTLAAPHIITGLRYMNEKKKSEARVAFTKAKALDPEDEDIDVLIKMAQ